MATLNTRANGETIDATWFNSIKTCIDQDLILTPLSVTADKELGIDANVISASSLSGSVDLDLPALADNDKRYYILKATDLTNGVVVNPDGSDTIDGEVSYTFSNADEAIAIVGDATNSNWVIVSTAFDSTGGGSGTGSSSIYGLIQPENTLVAEWNTTNLTNATLGLESTAPLAGDSSYKLTNATGAATEYITSPNVAVPLRSRNKLNGINFPYTYDGDDNDIEVSIYDVTNSATLETLLVKASSSSATGSIVPYIPESCESIQFRATVDVANDGAEFIFDDIEFSDSPFTYKSLYNVSDFETYTPTWAGLGTPTDVNVLWRRDGDVLELLGRFTTGTTSATTAQMSLPNSLTIDESKASSKLLVGEVYRGDSTAATLSIIATGDDNYVNFSTLTGTLDSDTPQNGNSIFPSSTTMYVHARIPITGWSSETDAIVHSDSGTENRYSAEFDGSAGASVSTTKESVANIFTPTRTGTGRFTIDYTPLGLSAAPILNGDAINNAARNITFDNISATSCDVLIDSMTPSPLDDDFSISLTVDTADYKNPSAYAITPYLVQTFRAGGNPSVGDGGAGDYQVKFDLSSRVDTNNGAVCTIENTTAGSGHTVITALKNIKLDIESSLVSTGAGDNMWIEIDEDGDKWAHRYAYGTTISMGSAASFYLAKGETAIVHASSYSVGLRASLTLSAQEA